MVRVTGYRFMLHKLQRLHIFKLIIIIIEGLSLLQSIPPTTADKLKLIGHWELTY